METLTLGRTGLEVSVLGFGCGAVGGLMVRGNPADQERAVARAVELGINYFDTAAMYGNGESSDPTSGSAPKCEFRPGSATALQPR
jgi:aryl-alcohol dehydrogenase-like predicted oxidoreductase